MIGSFRLSIENNRFAVFIIKGRIFNQVLIICRVSSFVTRDTTRIIELIRNLLVRLSELGGFLTLTLIRRQGNIECYLVLYNNIFSLSTANWVNSALAILGSFSTILGVKLGYICRENISDIARILVSKLVLVKEERKISLYMSNKAQLVELLRPTHTTALVGQVLANILRGNLAEKYFWGLMRDNNVVILSMDLNSLRHILKANAEIKVKTLFGNTDRSELLNKRALEKLFVKYKFRLGVFAGIISDRRPSNVGEEAYSELSRLRTLYYETFFAPFLALNQYLSGSKPKKMDIMLSSLLDLIIQKKLNVTINAEFDLLLLLITTFIFFLLTSRGSIRPCPQLGISESYTRGDIHVGWQLQDLGRVAPFWLSYQDLKRHILILGRTGSGKTRLAHIIVEQILRNPDVNVWIFDFHKEYLDLMAKKDFEVYEPGTLERPLYLNMFESQYEEPESYATFLTALLLEGIKLKGEEVSAQMERALSYAVWATVTSVEPNPLTFLNKMFSWCQETENDLPTAIYTFYAVANRVKSFFSGISKNIFWVSSSNVDIEEITNRNVIFDLSFLFKRNLKREILLLVNILLRYTVMTLFRRENLIGDDAPPRLVVLLEEGRYLVPWRRISSTMETTAVEDFATLARKYGLGLIIISQSPYLISPDIISNTGTLFLMNTEIPEKEYIILDNEELRQFIQMMPPKQAIVKLCREPALVHIEVKDYKPPKTVPRPQSGRDTPHLIIREDFEEYLRKLLAK